MNTNIIFLLLSVVILGCICMENKINNIENYEMYKQKPFGYIKTGSKSLNFYERPRFRKPYRYPFTFTQTYPIPHKSHFP